jgi:hypothetical protein
VLSGPGLVLRALTATAAFEGLLPVSALLIPMPLYEGLLPVSALQLIQLDPTVSWISGLLSESPRGEGFLFFSNMP